MEKSHESRVINSRRKMNPRQKLVPFFPEQGTTTTLDINSAVVYLSQFFSGQLNCNKCNNMVGFSCNEVVLHQQSCGKSTKNVPEKNDEIIKVKQLEKLPKGDTKNQEKCQKPYTCMSPNSNMVNEFLRYQKSKSIPANLNLIKDVSISSNMVDAVKKMNINVKSFQCLYCKLFCTIESWQKHVFECPITKNLSVSCICLLCETLIYGDRSMVIVHPHFKENDDFFSLNHYPHMAELLNDNLPRYFKFESKLLRTEADLQLGFYCIVCDLFCFQRIEKHLHSHNHKVRANLTCDLYFCSPCHVVIYGDERLITHHNLSRNHIMMEVQNKQKVAPCLENQKHRFLVMSLKFIIKKNLEENQDHRNFQCLSYYCDLCFYFSKNRDDWDAHLESQNHDVIATKAANSFEYICIFCKLSIFGTVFNHVMHTCSYGHENIKAYVIDYHNNANITAINAAQAVQPIEGKPKEKPEKGKPLQQIYTTNLEVKNPCELAINVRQFLLDVLKKTQLENCKTYNCWYCDFFSSERKWWNHLRSQPHIDKVNQYYQSSKSYKAVTLFCYCCNLLILGPTFVQNVHHKKSQHQKKTAKFTNIVNQTDKTRKSESSQSSDIETKKMYEMPKALCNGNDGEAENRTTFPNHTLPRSLSISSDGSSAICDNDEKSDDEEDELDNVILNDDAESDLDDKVSDHELDDSFLNEIKDDLPSTENTPKPENLNSEAKSAEMENKDNIEIVKHLIIAKGIPPQIIKNRRICHTTFSRYGVISRMFTKKTRPDWLYLVVLTEPEEVFNRLNRNIKTLKVKLGTDELSFEHDTRNTDDTGIKKQLTPEVEEIFSNEKALNEAVNELMHRYEQESNSDESQRRIKQLEDNVLRLAYTIYGNQWPIKVFVFGSRVTRLATENSDVDIYLQINNSFGGGYHDNTQVQQQLVHLFFNKMKQYYNDFKNVVSIPFARVPIVKFTDAKSKLNCDLSFKSGLSTMNSMLVKTYLELDDRIKFIVCGVKLWMKKNDLADRNLFTTYAQIWMVLYFLMQPEVAVVPTVIAIRNELPHSQRLVIVEGWNCAFPKLENIIWRSKCTLSKEQLLLKFFEFYSNENLLNYVMCTLTGLKIPKKFFLESYENLPPSFNEYKNRIRDRSIYWKVSDDFAGLCVQDPFDHCHNLTKTINLRKFNGFINLCQQTVEKLNQI